MNYIAFNETFREFPIISTNDIRLYFPDYDRNALTRWQKKGYLVKLKNGFYRLANHKPKGEAMLFFIANRLYQPSYVSLQSALSWYGFIPEGVFIATSICTRNRREFETPDRAFSYFQIKKKLFFGYQLEKIKKFYFKIASPEKALLDFFYFYPQYDSEADMYELRFNVFEIKEQVDFALFEKYLKVFDSKALSKRVKCFLKYLEQNENFG